MGHYQFKEYANLHRRKFMLLNIYPQIALVSFFQNQKALHMLNNNNNNNKTSKLENFRDIICHLKKKDEI